MYIALDESPLRLSAFQLQDVMTSSERLTHALTVHYLSAAILGAGKIYFEHLKTYLLLCIFISFVLVLPFNRIYKIVVIYNCDLAQ